MLPRARTAALLLLPALLACVSARPGREPAPGRSQRGLASWYGPGFHGRATANGEIYDMHRLTAAHRTLPFDTLVEVRNRDNGKTVRVRINDRGPFIRGRIIDLSYAAAQAIDLVGPGVAPVEVRVVRGGVMTAQAAGGAYVVQAGAFRDPDRARRLARELGREFAGVEVRSDGLWHRVQIGPVPTRREADRLRREIARRGHEAIVRVVS